MATPPTDPSLNVNIDLGQPIQQSPDVNFDLGEIDKPFQRYTGYTGRGLPVVNTSRAKALGLRRESDWKRMSWWRIAILNDPRVFAEFYESRLKELSLDEFNDRRSKQAIKTGTSPAAPLTAADRDAAIAKIEAIINANPLETETDKVNKLYDQIYNDPAVGKELKAFIALSLANQHGRETRGLNHYLNARKGTNWVFSGSITDPTFPTLEQFKDLLGGYSLYEALDTLKASAAFDGIYLDKQDKDNFSICSKSILDADGKPIKLVNSHITKVQVGGVVSSSSNYTIGPNVPSEELDHAICLMAEAIATHRQVCDLDTANVAVIAGGAKTPLKTMRMLEELICKYNMQIDLSPVLAKLQASIDSGGYSAEIKERFEQLQQLALVYDKRDAGKFNKFCDILELPMFKAIMQNPATRVKFEVDANGKMKDSDFNHYMVDKLLKDNILAKDIYANAPRAGFRASM